LDKDKAFRDDVAGLPMGKIADQVFGPQSSDAIEDSCRRRKPIKLTGFNLFYTRGQAPAPLLSEINPVSFRAVCILTESGFPRARKSDSMF
jgi:hypothetical protein